MDNGEEIPGLNEDWTFLGAKLFEWMAGFMALVLASEFLVKNAGRSMPFLVMIMIGTTLLLKGLRQSFPDEERGLRNTAMVGIGLEPPGIPAPSTLQPIWSASPLRALDEKTNFMQLGLDEVFYVESEDERDDAGGVM